MKTKNFIQKMSDGTELSVNRWIPDEDDNIKAVIQLNHGLSEHSIRYDRLGSILAENGFVFNAHDVRGHGHTAEIAEKNNTGKFGKLSDKKGSKKVVKDLKELIDDLKKEYPSKKIFLLGHSFGSFVAQSFIEQYSTEINGCILCGTAGPRPLTVGFGKILTSLIRLFAGNNKVIPLLPTVAFGSYNSKIENPKTSKDWLSRNEMNVELNAMDKWCNIDLTTSFYDDMMSLLCRIHKSKNIKKISKDLPVYFIYGTDDPVGNYGKTIEKLYKIYLKNGMSKVQIKAYKDDRHEIFNETDHEQVENDLISWINSLI